MSSFLDLVERYSNRDMLAELAGGFFGVMLGAAGNFAEEAKALSSRMFLLDDPESPDDVLPLIAENRGLDRYYLETTNQHRSRLIDAWGIYAKSASEQAIQDAFDDAGFGPKKKIGTWGAPGLVWGQAERSYVPQFGAAASLSGAGDLLVPYPTGIESGALLVVCLAREVSTHDSAPSGWTTIATDLSGVGCAVYARISPDPTGLPANLTFPVTGSGMKRAVMLAYNPPAVGWSTTVASNFTYKMELTGSGTSFTAPLNGSGPSFYVLRYLATTTASTPTGWTEAADASGSSHGFQVCYTTQTTVATTGTLGSSAAWVILKLNVVTPPPPESGYVWGDRGARVSYRRTELGPRGEPAPYWSQYWIVFEAGMHPVSGPPVPWGTFVWGDTYDGVWGPKGYSQDFKRTVLHIVKKWKSSRWVFRGIDFKIGTIRTWGQSGVTWGQSGEVWGGAISVPVSS